MVPMEVVATSLPEASVERMELPKPSQVEPRVVRLEEAFVIFSRRENVEDAPEKTFDPEKRLESERSVEEAAVIVMLPVPSKETPLMRRALWRAAAVPALPETDPDMTEEKVLLPEKRLESESKVVDAPVNAVWVFQ